MVPDCPFDILSASSSGSARRLFAVTGSTCRLENAEAPCAPDKRATALAIRTSVLLIGAPLGKKDCRPKAVQSTLFAPASLSPLEGDGFEPLGLPVENGAWACFGGALGLLRRSSGKFPRANCGSHLTPRWREMDSNHQY